MSGMLVYSQHHAHAWARCVTCRSARVTRNGYRVCSTSWRCDAPRTRLAVRLAVVRARAGPWARRAGYEPRDGTCGGSWPQGAPVSSQSAPRERMRERSTSEGASALER
eukprot:scaffold11021_cov132-Isochrysis_galbana.AAC.5